jgi:hypothetical protein
MPIFVFAILAPTLAFYFYALVQFWAEFRRRRHGQMKVIELRDTRLAPADFEPFPETHPRLGAGADPAISARDVIRPFAVPGPVPLDVASALRLQILTPHMKNRTAANASPAGPSPLKRAAKG